MIPSAKASVLFRRHTIQPKTDMAHSFVLPCRFFRYSFIFDSTRIIVSTACFSSSFSSFVTLSHIMV